MYIVKTVQNIVKSRFKYIQKHLLQIYIKVNY